MFLRQISEGCKRKFHFDVLWILWQKAGLYVTAVPQDQRSVTLSLWNFLHILSWHPEVNEAFFLTLCWLVFCNYLNLDCTLYERSASGIDVWLNLNISRKPNEPGEWLVVHQICLVPQLITMSSVDIDIHHDINQISTSVKG